MMNYFKLSFGLLLFCFVTSVRSQTISKFDIATEMATGNVTVSSSPLDNGTLANVFDRNFYTLARGNASNNPMVVTLVFSSAQKIGATRVLSATPVEWTLEVANSLPDLDNKRGSYELLVNKDPAIANDYDSAGFPLRTAYFIRLTLKRTTSDYYPHLREWELYGSPEPDKNAPDFSVCYIKRLPKIDYVWDSSNPRVEGWPAVGSVTTWRAYVKNWSPFVRNDIKYYWLWNGIKVDSGTVNFTPNGLAYADYNSIWSFERNQLSFMIDVSYKVKELLETNNTLRVYTDAISLNLYVERSLYNYFHKYQRSVNASRKTNSFEDWAQIRHVERWNFMLSNAKFPEAPTGVLDRIRIDSIIVVPDNTLPLVGNMYPTNKPNVEDLSVDLQWGFPSALINNYPDTINAVDTNPFYFEGSLLHELGHARYLRDNYAFDVHDKNGSTVNIMEDGVYICGSQYLPKINNDAVYYCKYKGLMSGEYTYIDRFSAAALNLIAGHRAIMGNFNLPHNAGVYLNDLPEKNAFILKDLAGNILSNADVRIYQSVRPDTAPSSYKYFDNIPDFILKSSKLSGKVLLPKNPFQADGHIASPGEGVILFRVETADAIGYIFFESSTCNLAYWRGLKDSETYTLKINMIPKDASSAAEYRKGEAEEVATATDIVVYPNPVYGSTVNLLLPEDDESREVVIVDMTSQIRYRSVVSGEESLFSIPVEYLPNGIYSILIKSTDGVKIKKFELLK